MQPNQPEEQPPRPRPKTLSVIYFGVAFTLATAGSMMLLTVFRPMMGELTPGLRQLAMLGPLLIGVPFGARVAWVGRRDSLPLGAALKRGLGM